MDARAQAIGPSRLGARARGGRVRVLHRPHGSPRRAPWRSLSACASRAKEHSQARPHGSGPSRSRRLGHPSGDARLSSRASASPEPLGTPASVGQRGRARIPLKDPLRDVVSSLSAAVGGPVLDDREATPNLVDPSWQDERADAPLNGRTVRPSVLAGRERVGRTLSEIDLGTAARPNDKVLVESATPGVADRWATAFRARAPSTARACRGRSSRASRGPRTAPVLGERRRARRPRVLAVGSSARGESRAAPPSRASACWAVSRSPSATMSSPIVRGGCARPRRW